MFVLIDFSLAAIAVVTVITPVREKLQAESARDWSMRRKSIMVQDNWRAWFLFIGPDKTEIFDQITVYVAGKPVNVVNPEVLDSKT